MSCREEGIRWLWRATIRIYTYKYNNTAGPSSPFPACTARHDVTGTDSCRNMMDGGGAGANKVRGGRARKTVARSIDELGTA